MTVISHRELNQNLQQLDNEPLPDVYLIVGEEFLVKQSLETLLASLLTKSEREFNYDRIDSAEGDFNDGIERLNTYSFLGGKRIVAFCDSKIFYAKRDQGKLLQRAKDAYDINEIKKSATIFAELIGLLNLSFEDIKSDKQQLFQGNEKQTTDNTWIDDLIDFCIENRQTIPSHQDSSTVLETVIKQGFPKGNHLIITTDLVDKRRTLYKAIDKHGLIIDCSVPKGNRMADKKAQEAVINETLNAMLSEKKKKMDPDARRELIYNTGFDLVTLVNNLEKLITYAGDRKTISLADINALVLKTKKDPIFELTSALASRNIKSVLEYVSSLLADDIYPLQILAAAVNQTRKLLIVKEFTQSRQGRAWYPGMQYNQFTREIIPLISEYDNNLLTRLEAWKNTTMVKDKKGKKKKPGKKAVSTDLLIAPNPKNAYPVYQLFKNAENYSLRELISGMEAFSRLDIKLKRSRQNPKYLLETVLINFCKRKN